MSVRERLQSGPAPAEIYHYTTVNGLIGILESNSLWASKIHYLNDSTEFELALSIAAQVLRDRLASNTSEREKVRCLLDNIPTIKKVNVCVTSLSQKRDLLSQWRAYGGTSGGFSIGMKSSHLVGKAQEQGFLLLKCIYDEQEQKQIVEALIDECLAEDFNTVPSYVDPDRPRTLVVVSTGGDFSKRLAMVAPVIKSKSFEEEAEWRLVSQGGLDATRLSFRAGASTLVPYYSFELGDKADYLASITIGPTPQPDLAAGAAETMVAKYGVSRTTAVFNTVVPFRNW